MSPRILRPILAALAFAFSALTATIDSQTTPAAADNSVQPCDRIEPSRFKPICVPKEFLEERGLLGVSDQKLRNDPNMQRLLKLSVLEDDASRSYEQLTKPAASSGLRGKEDDATRFKEMDDALAWLCKEADACHWTSSEETDATLYPIFPARSPESAEKITAAEFFHWIFRNACVAIAAQSQTTKYTASAEYVRCIRRISVAMRHLHGNRVSGFVLARSDSPTAPR